MKISIQETLDKRSLKNLLPQAKSGINLNIEEITAEAFTWILQHPYAPIRSDRHEVPRPIHGIAHANRVALYITAFANLYRRYHYPEALELTEDKLRLIQIAAVFHDSARLDDNDDVWDTESASLCFYYLRQRGYSVEDAKWAAELIANKDYEPEKKYYSISVPVFPADTLDWNESIEDHPKSFEQKLLHEGDCLDIIRARLKFNGSLLHFYKDIAEHDQEAFDEMAKLITEARSLISQQGDQYSSLIEERKRIFSSELCFSCTQELLKNKIEFYPLLCLLTQDNRLLSQNELRQLSFIDRTPYDPLLPLTTKNLRRYMEQHYLLARALSDSTEVIPSTIKTPYLPETQGELEARKDTRILSEQTRSRKAISHKEGNQLRSVSLIGDGTEVFAQAGILIFTRNFEGFHEILSFDVGSGHAKKEHLSANKLSAEVAQKKLADLKQQLKLGNYGTEFQAGSAMHTELLYHITSEEIAAVFYSKEPCLYSRADHHSPDGLPFHPQSPLIEALYLKEVFERQTKKKLLLVEYSGNDNFIAVREAPSEEALLKIWEELIESAINRIFDNYEFNSAKSLSVLDMYLSVEGIFKIILLEIARKNNNLDQLKSCCASSGLSDQQKTSPDNYYPEALKEKINKRLMTVLNKRLEKFNRALFEKIKQGEMDLNKNFEIFYFFKQ